jgi:hypothetical protein
LCDTWPQRFAGMLDQATHVHNHVLAYSNLRLDELQTKRFFRFLSAQEAVGMSGIFV